MKREREITHDLLGRDEGYYPRITVSVNPGGTSTGHFIIGHDNERRPTYRFMAMDHRLLTSDEMRRIADTMDRATKKARSDGPPIKAEGPHGVCHP